MEFRDFGQQIGEGSPLLPLILSFFCTCSKNFSPIGDLCLLGKSVSTRGKMEKAYKPIIGGECCLSFESLALWVLASPSPHPPAPTILFWCLPMLS